MSECDCNWCRARRAAGRLVGESHGVIPPGSVVPAPDPDHIKRYHTYLQRLHEEQGERKRVAEQAARDREDVARLIESSRTWRPS